MITILKETRSLSAILLALASLICLGLYWPGLSGPLALDDETHLGFLLGRNIDLNTVTSHLFNISGPLGRPVAMASFMANAALSQNIFYWKLTNVILHIITSFLVYVFIKKLQTWNNNESPNSLFAATIAIIWLLHPLHISTVLYTVQRMTQLATLFSLSGLICHLNSRQHPINSKSFLTNQALTWFVFFPLAIFSKETALLLPALILVIELFLIERHRVSNRLLAYLLIILFLIVCSIFLFKPDFFFGGYAVREFSLHERLLTQARVIVIYLSMLLIPTQKQMAFLHDDIELSTGLLTPWTSFPAIIALATLIGLSFYLRKKQPLFSAGILFFFTGHLLESSIFPLELMFEHRNYLPAIGFFLAIASVISHIISSRRTIIYMTSFFLLLLSFSTWLRADIWSSNLKLLHQIETNSPHSPRGAFLISDLAIKLNNFKIAREKLIPINTLGAKVQQLYINCIELKTLKDSEFNIDIKSFRTTDNFAAISLVNIANLGLNNQCKFSFPRYLNLLDQILKNTKTWNSNRQQLLMYKAHYQWRLVQKNQAIATLKQAFSVDRQNPVPLLFACEWAIDENMTLLSDEICPQALRIAKEKQYIVEELAEKVRNQRKH